MENVLKSLKNISDYCANRDNCEGCCFADAWGDCGFEKNTMPEDWQLVDKVPEIKLFEE